MTYAEEHGTLDWVESICRMLPMAPPTYYEQKSKQADPPRLPTRVRLDTVFCDEIKRAWNEHAQMYGAH
jgi:putative transposase